jgi:hypothetical protein
MSMESSTYPAPMLLSINNVTNWEYYMKNKLTAIIIKTDHLTTTPVLNQLKTMESMVFTASEAMKSVSY